jgi:AcrR family transcriptional regulator
VSIIEAIALLITLSITYVLRMDRRVGGTREQFVDAAQRLLNEHGPGQLTVRAIAEAAGASTMGVYTGFGSRSGMLEALYLRGFALLRAEFDAMDPPARPQDGILDLCLAYRRFALANPAMYAFLFERPLPDFDPDPAVRNEALRTTFDVLVDAVRLAVAERVLPDRDPVPTSYLIWSAVHGSVSLELTHAARRPLPGWVVTPQASEAALRELVQALLRGLASGTSPYPLDLHEEGAPHRLARDPFW